MTNPPEYHPDQDPNTPPLSPEAAFNETVWTYRGYKLRASEFTIAMVHFFRAEIQRANVWRSRLDTGSRAELVFLSTDPATLAPPDAASLRIVAVVQAGAFTAGDEHLGPFPPEGAPRAEAPG